MCDEDITALAFLGSTLLVTGDSRGAIAVRSTETGMELYRLPDTLPGRVTSLAVSPDGTTLTAGFAGGARRFTVARPGAWGHGRIGRPFKAEGAVSFRRSNPSLPI